MLLKSESVAVHSDADVVRVRQLVREWATDTGFGLVDQTKIVTAASELARNMILYARGGTVCLQSLNSDVRRGLRVVFQDQGPGIANIEMAMQDGYTTGNGLGLGLGGAKRLVNEFQIDSRLGEGTRITITRWK